jgi:hypothetical protein
MIGLKTPPHRHVQARMIARTAAKSVGDVRNPMRVGLRRISAESSIMPFHCDERGTGGKELDAQLKSRGIVTVLVRRLRGGVEDSGLGGRAAARRRVEVMQFRVFRFRSIR